MSVLRAWFGQGWLQGLLAVVLLGLFFWFAGPYLAFADYKPLESVTGRLVALLLLVIVWALIVQVRLLRAARSGEQLVSSVSKQADADAVQMAAAGATSSADAAALRERFQRAVAALKKSKRAKSLYDLPWYMIIGPPGSGKTTVLQNSGLEFPLEKEFGKDPLKGVGGTRNCDWWITDQAILLDTAGRYTTQDSNQMADRAGWSEFLAQLRKYRKRRPINGVLVAISVADLIHSTEGQREQHAISIRRRLEELHEQLRIPFPVYFVLTKADLLAGFSEYFDDLNQQGRAQVWGATFPLAASRAGTALQQLPTEYDLLVTRLQERIVERMSQERDTSRRASVHAFPAQIGGLKPVVCRFLTEIFRGSSHASEIWIRGCYFTSGTQEGMPVDRMLGAIARNSGLSLKAAFSPPARGKSYFISSLLQQVVFTEAGIAGVNRRLEAQRALGRVAAYGAIAVVSVLGIAALLWSYRANRAYIEDVKTLASQVLPQSPQRGIDDTSIEPALPRLDALRMIVDSADRHRENGPPWSMRWGLYQGRALGNAARDAYGRDLNAELGPWVGRQFEARLRELAASPDSLYEYLKAYLMMGEPKRLDPAQLKLIGRLELRRLFAADGANAERVAGHFDQWLQDPGRVQAVPLDATLVDQTRVALQQASLPLLMYNRMKLAYASEQDGRVQLDRELSVGSNSLFVRRSGRPLSEPLSALYTQSAFESFSKSGRLQLMKQFLEDGWVLGDRAPRLEESPRLAGDVLALYETDYIRAWDEVIGDITVRPVRDLADANTMLGLLASPSSPLKALLTLVNRHTNFGAAAGASDAGATAGAGPAAPAAIGGAATKLASASNQLDQILAGAAGSAAGGKPGARITAHFQALHRLVEGPPGGMPIDRTLMDLNQLQQQIRTAGSGAAGAGAVAQVMSQVAVVAAQLPGPLASVVSDVGASSGSLAMGEARTELGNRYRSQVVAECQELIGGRYPFNRSSSADVAIADFARVFGPGGVFDSFFQTQLVQFVDTSRSVWRWKEETRDVAAVPLRPFQEAERIRQAFFRPGNATPELQVSLTPEYLDADVNRMVVTLDGQTLEYSHGPQRALSLNWPSATLGAASVVFEDNAGGRANRSFSGPWSLFRLFDASQVDKSSETRFVLTLSAGGRTGKVALNASSIRNPFARPEMLRFRCSG